MKNKKNLSLINVIKKSNKPHNSLLFFLSYSSMLSTSRCVLLTSMIPMLYITSVAHANTSEQETHVDTSLTQLPIEPADDIVDNTEQGLPLFDDSNTSSEEKLIASEIHLNGLFDNIINEQNELNELIEIDKFNQQETHTTLKDTEDNLKNNIVLPSPDSIFQFNPQNIQILLQGDAGNYVPVNQQQEPFKNIQSALEDVYQDVGKNFTMALPVLTKIAQEASKAVGYYDTSLSLKLDDNKNILVLLESVGNPVIVDTRFVEFRGEGSTDESLTTLQQQLNPQIDDVFHHGKFDISKYLLEYTANNKGYFDGKWLSKSADIILPDNTAEVTLIYETGNRYEFDEVIFFTLDKKTGRATTNPDKLPVNNKLLHQLVGFEKGDNYDENKIANFNNSLAASKYFNNFKVESVLPTSKKSDTAVIFDSTLTNNTHNVNNNIDSSVDSNIDDSINNNVNNVHQSFSDSQSNTLPDLLLDKLYNKLQSSDLERFKYLTKEELKKIVNLPMIDILKTKDHSVNQRQNMEILHQKEQDVATLQALMEYITKTTNTTEMGTVHNNSHKKEENPEYDDTNYLFHQLLNGDDDNSYNNGYNDSDHNSDNSNYNDNYDTSTVDDRTDALEEQTLQALNFSIDDSLNQKYRSIDRKARDLLRMPDNKVLAQRVNDNTSVLGKVAGAVSGLVKTIVADDLPQVETAENGEPLTNTNNGDLPNKKTADDVKQDKKVPLYVLVMSDKPHDMQLGIGYGTDTGPRITAKLDNNLINKKGYQAGIFAEWSKLDKQIGFHTVKPWKHPINDLLTSSISYKEEGINENNDDWKTQSLLASIARNKYSDSNWNRSISLRYRYDALDLGKDLQNSERETVADLPIAFSSSNSIQQALLLGYAIHKTTADNLTNPSKGYRQHYALELASSDLASDANMVIAKAKLSGIYSFGQNNKHQFIGKLNGSYLWADDFKNVPYTLRFFAGGDQTIKGYDYNSLSPMSNGYLTGGQVLAIANAEYNYEFKEGLRGALFADMGNAYDKDFQAPTKLGVGFGVRWASPVGSVRVDIGAGVTEESIPVRLHLFIGSPL